MCTSKNYCSYCLGRLQKTAIKNGYTNRANQLTTMIAERELLRNSPKPTVRKIDLSEIDGKIAVDCDDTIGSFEADMRQALMIRDNLTYEEALTRYPSNPTNGIASWWSEDDDPDARSYEEFLDLEAKDLLYRNQPVREGAGTVLNWLNKETNGRVEFLTARPEDFNEVSRNWLIEKVGIDFTPIVKHSNKKEDVEDFEVILDDSVPHVKAITSHSAPFGPRRAVFMTRLRTLNAVPENEYVHKALSWRDVKKIFS